MRWLLSFIVLTTLALPAWSPVRGDATDDLNEKYKDNKFVEIKDKDKLPKPKDFGWGTTVPVTIPYNGWDTGTVEKDKVKIKKDVKDDYTPSVPCTIPYNGWNTGTNLTPAWLQSEPTFYPFAKIEPRVFDRTTLSKEDQENDLKMAIEGSKGYNTNPGKPGTPFTVPYSGWDTGTVTTPAWSQTRDDFLYFDKNVSSNLLDYNKLSKENKEKDKEAAEAKAGHAIKPGTPFTIPYSGWDTGTVEKDKVKIDPSKVGLPNQKQRWDRDDGMKTELTATPYNGWDTGTTTIPIGTVSTYSVPEPSTLALLGMGAFGILAWVWRRKAA